MIWTVIGLVVYIVGLTATVGAIRGFAGGGQFLKPFRAGVLLVFWPLLWIHSTGKYLGERAKEDKDV